MAGPLNDNTIPSTDPTQQHQTQGPQAWHSKYPSPNSHAPISISASSLLSHFKSGERSWKDFLLIDLRRNDHEGGTIRGSLNLPAQTLYASLPTLLELCKNSGIKAVIFYCGSSTGRGTRAAGWFEDLCKAQGVSDVDSLVLEGGIKGWVKGGEEFTEFMDEYEGSTWEKYS